MKLNTFHVGWGSEKIRLGGHIDALFIPEVRFLKTVLTYFILQNNAISTSSSLCNIKTVYRFRKLIEM